VTVRARDVCHRAGKLVGGERARQHGDALAAHANVAVLWSAYLGVPISARDAALMMVLLKVARTKTGAFNLDDYVDAAGYAAIAAEMGGRDE
jgi:Domain of unknown function (DUF6378)